MYRALYRKWRPDVFADVVGREAITTALKNQIIHGKIGHAYLLTGTRGTGKTTCAKIFAKAVNCLSPNEGDPCGKCDICTGIENGTILDVVEIDAASNSGVDNIRDLRDETAYTPSSCTYKVYIIDEVHMLSTSAFNALLKIMEEPPSHIIFILATTEIHKVPATILSRCQRYDFTRIPEDAISAHVSKIAVAEGLTLSADAAALIARLADGALRDALSILDTCAVVKSEIDEETVRTMAGVTDGAYLFKLSAAISTKNIVEVLTLVATLREKSIDVKRLCEELINHYRNLLLSGVGADGLLSGLGTARETEYKNAAKEILQADAITAIKALANALDRMGKGADSRIEFEIALLNLCTDQPKAIEPSYATHSAPVQTQGFAVAPNFSAANQGFVAPPSSYQSAPEVSHMPTPAPQAPKAPPVQKPQGALIPLEPFDKWDVIVENMEALDKLLYVYMKNSKAYYDGRRVLIDASDLFLEYIRKNEKSKDLIKDTIENVTGTRCAIGPYEKKSADSSEKAMPSADQALSNLAAMGVDVEITE